MTNQQLMELFGQLGSEDSERIFAELSRVKQRSEARLGSGIDRRSVRKIISKLDSKKR